MHGTLARVHRPLLTAVVALVVGMAVVTALWIALRPITPRIAFNDGLGYDGQFYAAMVEVLRGDDRPILAERPHYAYRPLPVAIVAASGLDVVRGFLLMNVAALVLAGGFLAATVARYSGGLLLPAVAVLWWAALPGSLRYAMYYPVLIDGLGLLFMSALIYAVVARLPWLFLLLVGPAMLARENLIVLVPMLGIALLPRGVPRATAWTVAAGCVALAALAWVRIAPPIPPAQPFDAGFELRQNVAWLLQNANDRALRFATSWLLALGLFAVVPLAALRATGSFLRREPAWAYYLLITIVLILAIGGDYDRYFLYLVPVLAVLAFGAPSRLWGPALLALVTGAHLIVTRVAGPLGTSEAAYLDYSVATMALTRLWPLALAAAALALASFAVLRLWPGTVRSPRSPGEADVARP